MVTNKDIQKLMEVFPIKDKVPFKGDFEDLRKDFSRLQTGIDAYSKAEYEILLLEFDTDS